MAGQPVAAVHRPGQVRVLAIRRPAPPGGGGSGVDWAPAPGYVIRPGDRVVVLATRSGLSGMLRPGALPLRGRHQAALPAFNSLRPKIGLPKSGYQRYAQSKIFSLVLMSQV